MTDVTKSDATDITDVVDIMEDPREYEVRLNFFVSEFSLFKVFKGKSLWVPRGTMNNSISMMCHKT